MSDGRWLVAGALVGLVGAQAVRKGSAAAKKTTTRDPKVAAAFAKIKGGSNPFPIPGISAHEVGPIAWITYEREQDLDKAAKATDKDGKRVGYGNRSPYYVLQKPGEPLPKELPKDAFAAYGPEVQPLAWELDEFPGWYFVDLDAAGGIGGGPRILAKDPKEAGPATRGADNGLQYVLYHAAKHDIQWGASIDDLVMLAMFREAALPGYGKIADPTAEQDRKSRIVEIALEIPDADQQQGMSDAKLQDLERRLTKLTASVLDVWRKEGEVFPPQTWKIDGFTPPRGTASFAYAMPGDPWAASWEWPASPQAQAKGAVRRRPRRSRVPGNRKAEVTLEGVLDKTNGFQWKVRGAFEYFGRDESGQIVLDSTGGFSCVGEEETPWGQTGDDDKGLMLFQTGAGWKAAVGFGWTFMRLLALLGGDRMDAQASAVRAAIRKVLCPYRDEKGKCMDANGKPSAIAWRAWYELAFGDRKGETAVVRQQHEIRSAAARTPRPSGWISRPDAHRQSQEFPVTIPAYEELLERLANEIAGALGRPLDQILEQQGTAPQGLSLDAQGRIREKVKFQREAHGRSLLRDLPFDTEARVRHLQRAAKRGVRKPRPAITDRVVVTGGMGVIEAMAVRYGTNPTWHLLDEDGEPVRELGTERPTKASLRAAIGRG